MIVTLCIKWLWPFHKHHGICSSHNPSSFLVKKMAHSYHWLLSFSFKVASYPSLSVFIAKKYRLSASSEALWTPQMFPQPISLLLVTVFVFRCRKANEVWISSYDSWRYFIILLIKYLHEEMEWNFSGFFFFFYKISFNSYYPLLFYNPNLYLNNSFIQFNKSFCSSDSMT